MLEYTAARGPLAHDLVSSCKVQLQRSEHCFAAYNVRNVDKLSGRTTGRLGGNRQDTAHTIGGTTVVMTPGRPGAAGAWATQLHLQVTVNGDCEPAGAEYTAAEPPAPQDLPGTTGWAGRKQPKPTPTLSRPQYLARDYGPNGDANGLCWSRPQHADNLPTIWCPPARADAAYNSVGRR